MAAMEQETLAEIIDEIIRRRAHGRGRELFRQAQSRGLPLSYTLINNYRRGRYGRPKPETLRAIAELGGIPESRVFRAARLPPPDSAIEDELVSVLRDLTPAERTVVLRTAREVARGLRRRT